ncbi:hypothetical protein L7E55_14020 [Pelotomaculum isophthalicicum JI]|uniref:Uncharacterized protein n=1 Tax=Pelotomaculum isophthalicicum JI TaxID=947010 RepID=A0A9X4H6Z0_9FIRM|nr:hypothetical protein [Pelotomaculum isophthalicicum]MDF9409458.1 hypothetical protein [Pelotomaculum isophthalicicum JI]
MVGAALTGSGVTLSAFCLGDDFEEDYAPAFFLGQARYDRELKKLMNSE